MKIYGLFFGLVSVEGERSRMPSINLRGRCGFGTPCDENRLSYGCETFGGNFGVCWSECIGNLPSIGESGTPNGSFVYEGWCYNINSHLALESGYNFFSGKVARVSRRDVNEPETEEDYQDYMAQIGMDGTFMGRPVSEFTQCKTDLDCKNASRACSIGCGNKIELPFDQLN